MSTPTKREIKQLIRLGHWDQLGTMFDFVPVFMTLPGGKATIDWRCVPQSMYSILQADDGQEYAGAMGIRVLHLTFARQQGICHYCRKLTAPENWSIDHRIPTSRGGANHPNNKVGACKRCNNDKANLTEEEFRAVINLPTQKLRKAMISHINKQLQATQKARMIQSHHEPTRHQNHSCPVQSDNRV